MHFTRLSAVVLGLAAFALTLPHQQEQRMTWTPRSLQRGGGGDKSNEKITIVDTTVVELSESSRSSEVEFTILVQEKIQIEEQKKKAKDNVRKNHYRNKNNDMNTIIIVITEIIDIRDSNNHNTRYMKHQLHADNGKQNQIIIQVTEVVAITISNSNNGRMNTKTSNTLVATAASEAVANAIQTVDPNAPFAASNQTMLLPSGAAAPQGQNVEFDPAAIVEDVTVLLIVEQVGKEGETS